MSTPRRTSMNVNRITSENANRRRSRFSITLDTIIQGIGRFTTQTEEVDQDYDYLWLNEPKGWCSYDSGTNQCQSGKIVFAFQIMAKIYEMFNQFLHDKISQEKRSQVLQYNNPSLKNVRTTALNLFNKVSFGTYCIPETLAFEFIVNKLQQDWSIYYTLNKKVYDANTVWIKVDTSHVRCISLDAFVYGFSKYDTVIGIEQALNKPQPDMPINPTMEPLRNSPIYAPPPHQNTINPYGNTATKTVKTSTSYNIQQQFSKGIMKLKDKIKNACNNVTSSSQNKTSTQEATMICNQLFEVDNDNDEESNSTSVEDLLKKFNINVRDYSVNMAGIIKRDGLDGGKLKRKTATKQKASKNKTGDKPKAKTTSKPKQKQVK